MKNIILFFSIMLTVAACCPASKNKGVTNKAPGWIKGISSQDGRLCAVGIAGATMVQGDAVEVADENCKVALAKNIKSFIVTASYDKVTSSGRGMYISDSYVSTAEEVTAAVVRNVEIIDHYYDKPGAYSGGQESTYALCCMPEGSAGR